MNKIKKHKVQTAARRPNEKGNKTDAGLKKANIQPLISRLPAFALLFVLLWLFCAWIYGDVFYMSRETSYFAWDKTLMKFLLDQDWGWLYAAGRLLLQASRLPLLGGALLALMLTVCAWLLAYILSLPQKLRWLSALLPWGFLSYFVALNYSVNYHRETSLLMALPLAAMVVLALGAAVKYIVTRKKISNPLKSGNPPRRAAWLNCGVLLLMFAAATAYCISQRDDLRRTCRMFRHLERYDWQAIIDEASACKRPSRSVAALYTIALAETDQLESRLFEIPYNFPKCKVREMDGALTDGVSIYTLDADFYAGLANSSYHNCMETIVKNGPQLFLLKRLARAALINGEKRLCWKYLQIIDRNPFEHGFVEEYKARLSNMAAVKTDPNFVHVYNKMPLRDSFEQTYRKPLFIGYNVALREGRTFEALHASLMACLYSKDLDGFLVRARFFGRDLMPEYYQQAVLIKSMKNNRIFELFPTIDKKMGYARLERFVKDARPLFRDQKKGQKVLRENWLGYYPYYMYFENLPTEEQIKEHEQQKEKGGVN